MLIFDSEKAARRSASQIDDPRVTHFHDPGKRAGKAIAQYFGSPDKSAWDFYLFYRRGVEWIDEPPAPEAWVHQLLGSNWADPAHYASGRHLVNKLHTAAESLL
jgi:hypothetical protein